MKFLVYELFSGVGFCNQLFSLETAIYLANISNRKLILLIRNPLCHCGRSSWDYGTFMDFFNNDYKAFLPHGIEVCYGIIPDHYTQLLNDTEKTNKLLFGNKFSQIGFVDKDIYYLQNSDVTNNNTTINTFLHGRNLVVFDISTWTHEYIYITESNASRCFYNFLTSTTNYQLMSNICESLTHLHETFYCIFNQLICPDNYIGIHFRFGDARLSTSVVNSRCNDNIQHVLEIIEKYKECNNEIVIMSDRKDTLYLANINNTIDSNITYTEDIIESIDLNKYFPNITDHSVVQFLLQKYICEKANVFIGYEGSTVSNYIQYVNYIKHKQYQHYTNKNIANNKANYSWVINGLHGGGIGWKLFFPDNIFLNKLKIITLTNDGYKHLTDNLLISLKKLGIEKSLKIYCIGNESYTYFKNKYCFNEVVQVDVTDSYLNNWVEYKAAQSTDEIGKKLWASITSYKIYIIHNELILGNDIIFIDGDIVFEKDPFKYMLDCLEPETELLIQNDHQENLTPNMCTGFFWMKSNENTINITNYDTILKNIDSFQNDQQYIRRFSRQINHKYLDLGLFPNGKYYRDNYNNIDPYIIHFNYDVSDYKIKRMKSFNKWYLDSEIDILIQNSILISSIDKVVKQNKVTTNSICKINDCNSICEFLKMRNIKIRQGYITQVDEHANKLLTHLKSVCDLNNIKNVIEIGFLAGHSAELFLKLNNHVNVTSIDDGALQSVSAGKEYINLNYPNRHTLIKGNSNIILNNDKLNDSQLKYDIILIDGSFKYDIVKQDIILSKKLAHSDTILIINNVLKNKFWMKYWTEEVSNATADLVSSGFITNLHNIDIDMGRGTVTCKYNNINETTVEQNTVIKRDNRIVIKCVRTAGFYSNLLGIIYNAYIHIINGIVPYILWQNPKYMGFNDDNIFNYFFEQDNIVIDNIHDKIVIENGYKLSHILEMAKESNISFRQQMSNMYNVVCKLKPEYQEKIENYVFKFNLNNKDGLHIRQTDRFIGGKGLIYAGPNMYTIESYINSKCIRNFYLATDCDDTFSYFKNKFECYSYALIRSHGVIGIHHSNQISPNNKLIAEEAFMEGMLLSKCKNLYRVTSNLTIFSLIVNPTMMYEDLTIVFKNEIISEHKLNDDLYIESFLSK
jgi:hypothetical protein